MNNQKLAQAFLQLSQAMTTIHEALLEQQQPVSEAQVRADAVAAHPAQIDPAQAAQVAPPSVAPPPTTPATAATPAVAPGPDPFPAFADAVAARPVQVDPAQAAQVAPPPTTPATATSPAVAPGPDPFLTFADQLKSILQTVAPGALNAQLSHIIERYAPGASDMGQGGIRKVPVEQYQNFLAEVRQAAAAFGGAAQ